MQSWVILRNSGLLVVDRRRQGGGRHPHAGRHDGRDRRQDAGQFGLDRGRPPPERRPADGIPDVPERPAP